MSYFKREIKPAFLPGVARNITLHTTKEPPTVDENLLELELDDEDYINLILKGNFGDSDVVELEVEDFSKAYKAILPEGVMCGVRLSNREDYARAELVFHRKESAAENLARVHREKLQLQEWEARRAHNLASKLWLEEQSGKRKDPYAYLTDEEKLALAKRLKEDGYV